MSFSVFCSHSGYYEGAEFGVLYEGPDLGACPIPGGYTLDIDWNECVDNNEYISPFMDLNAMNMYNFSGECTADFYVGDGDCHDQCNMERCSWDAGDCRSDRECEGVCAEMYGYWIIATGGTVDEMAHDEFCERNWDLIVDGLSYDPETQEHFRYWDPPQECDDLVKAIDFNNDSFCNFREFVSGSVYMSDDVDVDNIFGMITVHHCTLNIFDWLNERIRLLID